MDKSFTLFDSDSLKNFHKRIFFSMVVFLLVYFVAIYRILEVMLFTTNEINIKQNRKNQFLIRNF